MDLEDFGLDKEKVDEGMKESSQFMKDNAGYIGQNAAQLMDAAENEDWAALCLLADNMMATMSALSQMAKSQLIYKDLRNDDG